MQIGDVAKEPQQLTNQNPQRTPCDTGALHIGELKDKIEKLELGSENYVVIPQDVNTHSSSSSISSGDYLTIRATDFVDNSPRVGSPQNSTPVKSQSVVINPYEKMSKQVNDHKTKMNTHSPRQKRNPAPSLNSPNTSTDVNVNESVKASSDRSNQSASSSPSKRLNKSLSPVHGQTERKKESYSSEEYQIGALDHEWRIGFRQFLACMLSESALVEYFDRPFDLAAAIKKYQENGGYKISPLSP